MKREHKILKLKKMQIAALKSHTILGGNSERKNCYETTLAESILACSQSIGTGETTSLHTDNCHVNS